MFLAVVRDRSPLLPSVRSAGLQRETIIDHHYLYGLKEPFFMTRSSGRGVARSKSDGYRRIDRSKPRSSLVTVFNADIAPLVKSYPESAVSTKATSGRTWRFENLCQETYAGVVRIQTSLMRSKWRQGR
jgi:hypothetical protein